MPRITRIPWKRFEKFLFFVGCTLVRERGDHRVYWRSDLKRPVVIPREREMPVFVIRNNLRILGVSQQEYLEILKRVNK